MSWNSDASPQRKKNSSAASGYAAVYCGSGTAAENASLYAALDAQIESPLMNTFTEWIKWSRCLSMRVAAVAS